MTAPRHKMVGGVAVPASFGYDAIKPTTRRRAPATGVQGEHAVISARGREQMTGTAQDLARNAALAAWMLRRHLDYVSGFRLSVRTGSDPLDSLLSRLFAWHAQPRNFDIAGRFGREEMFRMFEAEKVLGGDAGMLKNDKAMKLQAIESDLIAYPRFGPYNFKRRAHDPLPVKLLERVDRATGAEYDDDAPGRVARWCLCWRGPDGKSNGTFHHLEPAENVIFDAYYSRYSSQVRGVSPLSAAINLIEDSYRSVDLAMAKAKMHSIFGIAIMRDYAGAASDEEEVGGWGAASGIASGVDGATSGEGDSKVVAGAMQRLRPEDILTVDMDTRGKIDTIESKTPSTEFREFQELVIRLALLALDIPYSAYNSRAASFAGLIADHNLYEVACRWKREKNAWKRREYSDWLIERAWEDEEWGLRSVAVAQGKPRMRDVQEAVEWVAAGSPWLQKLQETDGDARAIALGLDNPIDAARRRGKDVFDNIEKAAEVYAYARERGVPLAVGMPGQVVADDVRGDPADGGSEDE